MRIEVTETFSEWLDALRDLAARARIQARIERLASGNPGQHRALSRGISELKIDVGPGYRVYYLVKGNALIVLLAGGNKSSQEKDIKKAFALAENL